MDGQELHNLGLKIICRICGRRCEKWPVSKRHNGTKKEKHSDSLKSTYKVDVNEDCSAIHPANICQCCIGTFTQELPSRRPVQEWTEHGPNCLLCKLVEETRRGGRRPKPAKVAAKRRKEREKLEKEKEAVKKACDTILSASTETIGETKQLKHVATAIIKSIMDETQIVELPTGGPVSINYAIIAL